MLSVVHLISVLSNLFGLVLFFNFCMTTGSACFLYTYLCIFLLLVKNKFYIICFKLCVQALIRFPDTETLQHFPPVLVLNEGNWKGVDSSSVAAALSTVVGRGQWWSRLESSNSSLVCVFQVLQPRWGWARRVVTQAKSDPALRVKGHQGAERVTLILYIGRLIDNFPTEDQ